MTRFLATAIVLFAAARASADPYRLRADALASVPSPSGLVSLQADGDLDHGMRAEALLWLGDDGADALVADIEAERGPVQGRAGRFVASLGALRPVQVDGASGRLRLPKRFVVEAFGGVPVAPSQGEHAWDWVIGTRASRLLGDWGSVGLGWLERRTQGRLDANELGADAGIGLGKYTDAGGQLAWDVIHAGVADAQLTVSTRRGAWRADAYAGERSPSRLLPATSLFSVIGDSSAGRGGFEVRWKAAPRLVVRGRAGAVENSGDYGEDLSLRAELALDDNGAGAITGELRRDGAPEGAWTGARATVRVPIAHAWVASAELELAVPDHPQMNTGTVWPWGLVAASWHRGMWEAAAAVEASSTPQDRYRIDALARLGRRWEL